MIGFLLAYGADQKTTAADYAKLIRVSTKNCRLHSLVVANKSGSDFFVQIFDVTGASDNAATSAADLAFPEFEVPCQGNSFVPFSFPGGWEFKKGCFVRCVTVANGGSTDVIAGNDAKFTAAYMDGPVLS